MSPDPIPRGKRRRFKPRLWTTVATIPVLAILIALGLWQIERMEWKNALVDEMQSRMTQAPAALPKPLGNVDTLRFQRVELTGRFLNDHEIYRAAQTYGKTRRGWDVITPFALADGRQILVNRGWVPTDKKPPEARPQSLVTGQVTIEGIVRKGGWSGMEFVKPENDPADNTWVWMDLDRMARFAALESPITQIYVDVAKNQTPGEYPIGGQTRVNLRNQHFNYAITWFALAFGLLAIYFLFHWRPVDEHDGETTSAN
ncbi:SURF1 family protein [Rhodovibrio salinarum]|uniref:SURF1-like protein n=1 Tax=Rhodovibrio salinarum TaxID=1087 RepID=A0A934QGS3_9PROT|nr:SURF1 family protein [Rhodovibrio salinarum]MBK1696721.1 SURF1 family protein [Rhodovibrio salinarum]